MGVDATSYLVIGYKIDKKTIQKYEIEPYSEEALPYVEGHRGIDLSIIYDQMCGNYIIFGKEIASHSEYSENEIEAIPLDQLTSQELRLRIKNDFIRVFGQHILDILPDQEPQILIFTHYS